MEESEAVPLKNISNSIIVRESARKLITKAEYDTRGISFTGAKIVHKSEHSSAISTEHNESVVIDQNENDDCSSANETLFKNQEMGVSIKEDIFNNGTKNEKCQEHFAHFPLNKLESKSLRADISASSKFNIHVEEGHCDNVDSEPIARTSFISVPSDGRCGVNYSSSNSVDNLVSTDANIEVSESLEKDLLCGPKNKDQGCNKSHLGKTLNSLENVSTSMSIQRLVSGIDSVNKEKSREKCNDRAVNYLEVSKSFGVDLSDSRRINIHVEKHCDVDASDKPIAYSSSIPTLTDNQHEISERLIDSSENLTSIDGIVSESASSTLQKDLLVSSLNSGQRSDKNSSVGSPQSLVNVATSISQQRLFSGTDSVNDEKTQEQYDHEIMDNFKEPKGLRGELSVSTKFNVHVEREQCDSNVDDEAIADSSSIPDLPNSQCEISIRPNDFPESSTSKVAMVSEQSTIKDLPVISLTIGQRCEENILVEFPHSAKNVPSLMNEVKRVAPKFAGIVSPSKEKSSEQCDQETEGNFEGSKSDRANLSVSSKFCDIMKNEHCEVKESDKSVADSSSLGGIDSTISNNSLDLSETSTNANVVVSQSSIPKIVPISPVNDTKCMEETPLTSTPHYINPFFKRGKRCKKSISEKINEIVVENVKEENNVEEITNPISCEKTDSISSTQMSSKVEPPKEKKVEGSNANVRNSSSPSAREDVSRVISRNFFSPPTKVHVGSEVNELQIVYEKIEDNSSTLKEQQPEENLESQIRKLKENVSKGGKKHSPIRFITQELQPKDSKYKAGVNKYLGKTSIQKLKSKENICEEESKKGKESAMNVCFVSDDPCENEDNNNPEWLALKKLETDEERYKAVRKRWKNLTIPDPNKNLTYIQIKSCFKRTSAPENVEVRKVSHKRAFSYEPSTSKEDLPPAKRSRTRSCTTSYDKKIQDHWRNMEEKEKGLLADKEKLLQDVRCRFNKARNHLLDSGLQFLNFHEYQKRLSVLRSQQRQDIEEIFRKYLNAKMELENEGHKKSKIFNAALEEVKAFHNFYSNLDDKVNDCYFLTEPELEDVEDTNRLYQKFFSFYSH